jgi:ribosomal protein S18 acetylase RimI-like enzyme
VAVVTKREPTLRPATVADAAALAELVDMAGEGLPRYVWSKLAEPGEDAWEIGRRRAARDTGSFSWRNATVLESDGAVVGGLVGYVLPASPEAIDYAAMPPMFVPLQELENLSPSRWCVNVLAVYPEHRGKGHGTRLLALADRKAAESGANGLSIIVSDGNPGARRLYERIGCREIARRAMVKEDWTNPGENWVLLVKPAS